MGGAMAGTLHRAGFDLVLWNRDVSKAKAVAAEVDAEVADSAAAAAAGAPVVLTSLADDAALLDVYLGPGGVVAGIEPGATAVDTSTVDPETVRRVGDAVDGTGAGFLDAPVIPVGERGSGAAAKLAVNALVHGLNVALSEALVLAERAGVDRKVAYEVFASGAAGAPFVQYKRAAYEEPDNAAVAFSLDLVAKDLDLITGLGKRVGVPLDQAEVGLDIVHRAIASGLGGADLSAIAVYLREAAS
jgi:3-hydroxyisobutyrate dehydrogenase-like beta-hydroxyacid dehydrogenase